MRGRIRLLPLLAIFGAALWPIADIMLASETSVDPVQAGIFLLLLVVAQSAVAFLVGASHPRVQRGAAIVAPITVLFFSYPIFEPGFRTVLTTVGLNRGGAISYFLVLFIVFRVLRRASRTPENRKFLLLVPTLLGATSALAVIVMTAHRFMMPEAAKAPEKNWFLDQRPNIYHFLFDALGRPDAIERTSGIAVPELQKYLGDRGFVQSSAAISTKLSTIDSINAVFSPNRPADNLRDLNLSDSLVLRTLKRSGYKIARYGEVFSYAACEGDEDECILGTSLGLSEFYITLLRRTPMFPIVKSNLIGATTSRKLAENLSYISSRKLNNPSYVFSYMLPPHPPFIFQKNCQPSRSGFDDFRAWRPESLSAYVNGYNCVARALGPAIDIILDRDPDAIIIVSGDHGPSFAEGGRANPTPKSEIALVERQSVFLAIRGPVRCRHDFEAIARLDALYPTLFDCLTTEGTVRANALYGGK